MSTRKTVKIVNNVVDGGPTYTVPAHLNFGQFMIDQLRETCTEDPEKVALINGETGQEIKYKQILQDAVNVTTGLRKLGVKRGDVIAFCSENCDQYMPTVIAGICCGATVTTANLMYTKDEMIHCLNISKPKIMFSSEAALKLNLKTFQTMSFIKKIIQFNGTPIQKNIIPFSGISVQANVDNFEVTDVEGATDLVYIIYSSGTTGLPKGVMLSHLNALYSAAHFLNTQSAQSIEESGRLLTIVPWYHAYGLMATTNNIAIGKLQVYFAGFHPQKYLQAIKQYQINKLLTVPPIVVFLAKAPGIEKFDLSSVRSVWCGAAPLSAETINAAMKRLPNCRGIFQAYGMTETSLAATQDVDLEGAVPKAGSGGVPLSGVKAKVVDTETGQKLGPNQTGEICLKGPIIMKGYFGNKAATRAMIDEEGFLKTGDLGYYDKDGCFFIVDRLKELIKYKGSQVPPAAVESVILQHEGVAECGVVGKPDEAAGELPTAFIVLKPGAQATEQELIEFTNARLSPEKRLHGGVILVKEIPKNPSGKILRRVLKQQLRNKKKSKL